MPERLGRAHQGPDREIAFRHTHPDFRSADGVNELDTIVDAILKGAGPDSSNQASALSRADGATRARAITRLQQTHGNAYVQRVATGWHNASSAASAPGLAVQREGEDEDKFKYSLLPPQLTMPMGPLSLSADTGKAELGYKSDPFSAKLGYEYGGDVYGSAKYKDFSAKLGFNPSEEAFSLGGSYGGVKLGMGASESKFSGSLSYGSPLLPWPWDLSSAVYKGEAGAEGVLGALPGAMNDPLGTYSAQKPNIDAAKGAYDMLGKVGEKPKEPWGVGVRGSWTPEEWKVMAALRANF